MPRDDTAAPLRAAERTAALTNTEAEQCLLGTLMRRNEVFHRVVEIVRLTDFAVPLHAHIFEAIGRLVSRGDEANPVTLQHEFDSHYLAGISNPPTLINGEGYARLIRDLAQRRTFIVACEEGIDAASHTDRPFSEITETFDRRVIEVDDISGGAKQMSAVVDAALAAAERTYKGETGLTTGLVDLDDRLGGLHPSELVILAGRPGMGKSALALGIGRAVARSGKEVLIFSLEMSDEQLGARELAVASGISAQDQRRAISHEQMDALISVAEEVAALPVWIDDAPATSAHLRARVMRHKRRRGGALDLVIVDYLQLVRSNARPENRVQEVSAIVRELKELAKELRAPVIVLSQLSRALELRPDKRPLPADLRDSGEIEQVAETIIFVYREEYYVERTRPQLESFESDDKFAAAFQKYSDKLARAHGVAELIISKNRQGGIGTVRVQFDAERIRFQNLTRRGDP